MEGPRPHTSNPVFPNAGRDQISAPSGTVNGSEGTGNHFPEATFSGSVSFGVPLKDRQVDEATTRSLEKGACLRSLGFRDIDARLHDIAAAYRGTCDWLFSTTQFQRWRDRADLADHNGVLWIKGKPGAGKSTLMKHALRHCEEVFADHLIVAHFFNARGEVLEKTLCYKAIRTWSTPSRSCRTASSLCRALTIRRSGYGMRLGVLSGMWYKAKTPLYSFSPFPLVGNISLPIVESYGCRTPTADVRIIYLPQDLGLPTMAKSYSTFTQAIRNH